MAHVEGIESTKKNINHALYQRFYMRRHVTEEQLNGSLGHCIAHDNENYTIVRFYRTSVILLDDGSIHPEGSTCDKCKRVTDCTYISVHLLDWEYTESQRRLHELHAVVYDDRLSLVSWCSQCVTEIMNEEFGADTRCYRCNIDPCSLAFPVESGRLRTISRVKKCIQ